MRHVTSRIVTSISSVRCQYCDYKTADSSSLNRHMWRHKDTKPYSCRLCSFNCIQRTQMMAHYKNKHSLAPQDAKKLITSVHFLSHSFPLCQSSAITIQ